MASADRRAQLLPPLEFAAKNDFRNLDRVKELGATLARMAEGDADLAEFAALARDLDTLAPAEKRSRVEALLAIARGTTKSVTVPDLVVPVTSLKGVGEKLAVVLEEKGVRTVRDLLY